MSEVPGHYFLGGIIKEVKKNAKIVGIPFLLTDEE